MTDTYQPYSVLASLDNKLNVEVVILYKRYNFAFKTFKFNTAFFLLETYMGLPDWLDFSDTSENLVSYLARTEESLLFHLLFCLC